MGEYEGLSYDGKPITLVATLPGNDLKQSAVLGHLILNQQFFMQAFRKIQPNWFRSGMHSKVYQFFLNLYNVVQIFPSITEFKQSSDFLALDQRERNSLYVTIDKALADSTHMRLEFIKPELTEWLHSKILFDSMKQAAKAWNAERFGDAAGALESAVKQFHETKFEEGSEITFDNPSLWLSKTIEQRGEALTTGLTLLDKALLTTSSKGGLQLGDSTLVIAPVNVGKTSFSITIARHNLFCGKSVFLMSHEGRPEDIRLKILRSVLAYTEDELFNAYKTKEGMAIIEQATNVIKKNLVYIPYNKAGMKVEDVMPIIRRTQEDWAAKHNGEGFQLFICDLPLKLTTEQAARGHLAFRNVIDLVYENYNQLALEYKWHSIINYQTNREGSKINKGIQSKGEDKGRVLGLEDLHESFAPAMGVTNALTLNVSPQAKRGKRMAINVCKSRGSEGGQIVVARTDFAHAITHSNTLGATSYYGTRINEDTIETHLTNMNGQIIPAEVL